MLFILEVPDASFTRSMVNRQMVAKAAGDALRASSPRPIPPWSGEDPSFEEYVFHDVVVRALPRRLAEQLSGESKPSASR